MFNEIENKVFTASEIEAHMERTALFQMKKMWIVKNLCKAISDVESGGKIVTTINMNADEFMIFRKYLKDDVALETNSKNLKKGVMGKFCEMYIVVDKDVKDVGFTSVIRPDKYKMEKLWSESHEN